MNPVPPTPDPPPLRSFGPYTLHEKIGGGGMGRVYRATHVHLKRTVAVKFLTTISQGDQLAHSRFKQEMEAIGRLKHPNIIAAVDAGEAAGIPYLVMEYVEGITLARILRARGSLSIANACEVCRQTAEALVCLTASAMVHRDIKPSNLLLGRDGIVRVLDLGLAKLVEHDPDHETLTGSHQVMGTCDFMAPEQGISSRDVDIRADIYSLGCTLYTLLSGHPPFSGPLYNNGLKKMQAHQQLPIPPLAMMRGDIPPELSQLLDEMLVKSPSARLGCPQQVANRLAAFTHGHTVEKLVLESEVHPEPDLTPSQVRTPTGPYHPSTPGLSDQPTQPRTGKALPYRWRWVGIGLLVLLVLSAVLFATLVSRRNRDPNSGGRGSASKEQEQADLPTPLEPGVWHDLLDHPPKVVEWPKGSPHAEWRHDPEKRSLFAKTVDKGVFEVANVQGTGFDLAMEFNQIPWTGGVGVFFRGRDELTDGGHSTWADCILVDLVVREKDPLFAPWRRGQLQYLHVNKKIFVRAIDSAVVPGSISSDQSIKITVNSEGLKQIEWNGKTVCENFCDPQQVFPTRPGAHGAIGFIVMGSSVTISKVQLRIHTTGGNQP